MWTRSRIRLRICRSEDTFRATGNELVCAFPLDLWVTLGFQICTKRNEFEDGHAATIATECDGGPMRWRTHVISSLMCRSICC